MLSKRLSLGIILLSCGQIFAQQVQVSSSPGQPQFDNPGLQVTVKAFPTAEGFGADAVGGRGGQIHEVVNLDDSGPGSLREAIEATGPRIVVFRIGGTIALQSELIVSNPYLTIAGQTAPAGGITLRDYRLTIATHDVIVRHLRSRLGATVVSDAFAIGGPDAHDVIFDHCSASWGVDENFSVGDQARDITIQWCVIAEGLAQSIHPKGLHSMGMLLGAGAGGLGTPGERISVHHNLFIHNNRRNPRSTTSADITNNVIYNCGRIASQAMDVNATMPLPLHYVGNYHQLGLSSRDCDPTFLLGDGVVVATGPGYEVFVQGNIGPDRMNDNLPEELVVNSDAWNYLVSEPHDFPAITTTTAEEARDQVLAQAGAIVPHRDMVDLRLVNDFLNGTGQIINDPADVGGWPVLDPGIPPADSDRDGMPDFWG